MVIKKWKGKKNMENVISFEKYLTDEKFSCNSDDTNMCEWDIISNIFSKARERKGMTLKQSKSVSKKILKEVRQK